MSGNGGVTDHLDHARLDSADAERRMVYQSTGTGAQLKSKTLAALLNRFAPKGLGQRPAA